MASRNFYTVITVACTLGALVYVFATQPEHAPIFMAAALPFAVGIIGQLQQSRENTDKIEQVDGKVDGVHRIVNSRMDEFKQALVDVAALKEQQAGVLAELTAAKAELTIANERARGIAIGREQAIAEVAPTGSTPPRGTAKSG